MLFSSPVFIFYFLPIVLGVSILLRSAPSNAPYLSFLVIASVAFYGYTEPSWILVMVGSIVVNYLIGWALSRASNRRKVILVVGVAFNLGLLAYFKYTDFLLVNAAALLGLDPTLLGIVLPIGISFYTFQQIAYLVDVFREPEHRYPFLDYVLFVTFFPQLIAGPIVHHKEFLPQTLTLKRSDYLGDIAEGTVLFLIGLTKKVLLADSFGAIADSVFADPAEQSSLAAWMGVTAYALQIYFDFSGYSDMAIGLGLLFGFRLPVNFDAPYQSRSIIEFWRRWHMTLSRFLRDYLYFTLGGNRRGKARRYVNLLATMALGGLWHGAGWGFVIWGVLHGTFLAVNHALRSIESSWLTYLRPMGWPLTLICVVFAWVPFRASSLDDTFMIWRSMLMPEDGVDLAEPWAAACWLAAGTGIVLFAPTSQAIVRELFVGPDATARARHQFAAVAGAAAAIGLALNNRIAAFLYFQF